MKKEHYTIRVGTEKCNDLLVTEDQIQCIPPLTQPDVGLGGESDGAPAVTVSIQHFICMKNFLKNIFLNL